MNVAVLAPMGLFALGALLLPILLHLARRTPQRRTEFAALRWLAARLRPRRRLRLEEPWLLLLRLLLVACVALLLAQPVWTRIAAGAPWALVHPAIAAADARAAIDCKPGACEWRWLAPGFPSLEAAPPGPLQPTASLLRELDAILPSGTALIVAVPTELTGLDAERPRLARAVDWRILPAAPAVAQPATTASPFVVALRGAADAQGRRYLRAAARAQGWTLDEAAEAAPPRADVVFWLDATPLPAPLVDWARQGGTVWLAAGGSLATDGAGASTQNPAGPLRDAREAWRDAHGDPVARELTLGRGRLLQWQRELQPDALPLLLEPAFARGLADTLQPPETAPRRAPAEALRPRLGGTHYTPPPRPLDAWLVTLALVLFAAERLLATRRGRSVGA